MAGDSVLAKPGASSWHFTAGADLSANQYKFVKADGTEGRVVAIAAATDLPVAVQADKAANAANLPVETISKGVVRVIAGAAIAAFARIGIDSAGRAITLVEGSYNCGYALTAAAQAGDYISAYVDLVAPQIYVANRVGGIAAGYKIARGTKIGTATPTVATGLATITGFAVSPVGSTATLINQCRAVSAKVQASTPGTLAIFRWKHTAPSTCTLIASTVAGTVSWVAVGT